MYFDSGILVEGCAAGAPGTTLTVSWATTEDLADDPANAWVELAVQEAGPFSVPFVPPARALTKGVVFRAEVEDPQGRTFAVLGPEYMEVRSGCGAPVGGAPVIVDACVVATDERDATPVAAEACDAAGESGVAEETGSGSESGESPIDDVADTDTDAAITQAGVHGGCGCTADDAGRSAACWVPLLVWLRRRRRPGLHRRCAASQRSTSATSSVPACA
jgi:hypothetical protein